MIQLMLMKSKKRMILLLLIISVLLSNIAYALEGDDMFGIYPELLVALVGVVGRRLSLCCVVSRVAPPAPSND